MTATMLMGSQEPRIKSVPRYSVSLGDEAVDFAAKAGLFLDPWQQMVLRESLGMVAGGKWAAPNVGLLVPRQNGKGSVLEALELFHMFALNTPLIVHSAHKFDTSQEHFLRLRNLIEGNPEFERHVKGMPTSQGHEAIVLRNGNRLKFKARTVGGAGRGFSADLLVLDEAMLLPEQALDAMMPTLRARKNPQVWFTSSAGMPESTALWRIVKRGREGAARLAYFEWGCESGVDVRDPANWALANPGFGYRLSQEGLEDDLELLSDDGFAREHLGIWDDAASDSVFPAGTWDACGDLGSQIEGLPVFSAVVSVDRRQAAIGVCGAREDGLPHLEMVQNGAGTTWIVPTLAEITSRNGGSVVIDPSSPAGSLADDLKQAGVRVHLVTARDYAQACGWVFDAVQNKQVHHLGQPELDQAVRDAQLRTLAGGFAWDLRAPLVDITPLVAVTLACWGHRTYGGNVADNVW